MACVAGGEIFIFLLFLSFFLFFFFVPFETGPNDLFSGETNCRQAESRAERDTRMGESTGNKSKINKRSVGRHFARWQSP